MRKFMQNKLWRDKAIEMLEQQGSRIHWHVLAGEELLNQLRLKLLEEATEVSEAKNRQELITELADVLEVIDAIAVINTISSEEIAEAKLAKQEKRGGFLAGKFVEISEHPAGSAAEEYCLSQPEKYPEIFDL